MIAWAAESLPIYRKGIAHIDDVNRAFIRAVLETSGAKVFADTSKRLGRLVHLLRLPDLDVRLVLLIRDVRAYAASAKRRGEPVFDAARTWQRDRLAFGAIADSLPPGRVHRVRYEDLCSKPDETLAALWRFCGVESIPAPAAIDASQHHVLGNSMRMGGQIRIRLDQTWSDRLDLEEKRRILEIAGELNQQFGYV